jgi:hypothetical protein
MVVALVSCRNGPCRGCLLIYRSLFYIVWFLWHWAAAVRGCTTQTHTSNLSHGGGGDGILQQAVFKYFFRENDSEIQQSRIFCMGSGFTQLLIFNIQSFVKYRYCRNLLRKLVENVNRMNCKLFRLCILKPIRVIEQSTLEPTDTSLYNRRSTKMQRRLIRLRLRHIVKLLLYPVLKNTKDVYQAVFRIRIDFMRIYRYADRDLGSTLKNTILKKTHQKLTFHENKVPVTFTYFVPIKLPTFYPFYA